MDSSDSYLAMAGVLTLAVAAVLYFFFFRSKSTKSEAYNFYRYGILFGLILGAGFGAVYGIITSDFLKGLALGPVFGLSISFAYTTGIKKNRSDKV